MSENKTLDVGTKYLSCKMNVSKAFELIIEGLDLKDKTFTTEQLLLKIMTNKDAQINFPAFKNAQRDKNNPKDVNKPIYKSDRVAIWMATKKEASEAIQEDVV